MNRKQMLWIAVSGLILLLIPVLLLTTQSTGAGPSVLSRGRLGWIGAHRYLASHGTETTLFDRPLAELRDGEVLILAFPRQLTLAPDGLHAVENHLRKGKVVIYAFSGRGPAFRESFFASWLDVNLLRARGEPPLGPMAWLSFAKQTWQLEPQAELAGAVDPVVITAPVLVPEAPSGAQILYRGQNGLPCVYSFTRLSGTILVLPAEALSNSRLADPGNSDLLASLGASLQGEWVFDEYGHGLAPPRSAEERRPQRIFDLLGLHLLLCYLLALLALARRFGPVWHERTVASGSTASLLLSLGRVHDQLGHHNQAARLLWNRAAALDHRLKITPELLEPFLSGRQGLLRLAQRIGKQHRGSRVSSMENRDRRRG
jgi:hypothetical protein